MERDSFECILISKYITKKYLKASEVKENIKM